MKEELNECFSIEKFLATSMNMSIDEYKIYLAEYLKKNKEGILNLEKERMNNRPNKCTKALTNELHELLVQTCIEFINKNKIHDIAEVSFSADNLQTSADHKEWHPATDSSLTLNGYKYDLEDNICSERVELFTSI